VKKIVNIIEKSTRIKNRLKSIVGGKRNGKNKHYNDSNHHHNIELDGHNDSSNWSYA
jgi:hypothetical protein